MSDAGFPLFRLDDISAFTLKTLKVTLSPYHTDYHLRLHCAIICQTSSAKVITTLRIANSLDTAAEKTE